MSLPFESQSSDIRNRLEENNSLSVPQNQQKEQIVTGEDAEMISGSDGVNFQYLKGLRLHLITAAYVIAQCYHCTTYQNLFLTSNLVIVSA